MAEFKTRLFIFCAGKLLKWADSIERELSYPQSRPTVTVDDHSPLRPANPTRAGEAASGPPEHWVRLVTGGPPQHWIDLIRERAPQLLPLNEFEKISPQPAAESPVEEFLVADSGQDIRVLPGDGDDTEEIPEAQPLSQRRPNSAETKYPSALRGRGSTWLNRLRFQPPSRPKDGSGPIYARGKQSGDSDSSATAGGIAAVSAEGSESPVQFAKSGSANAANQARGSGSDRSITSITTPETVTRQLRHWSDPSNDEHDNERHQVYQAKASSSEWPRLQAEPEPQKANPEQPVKHSRPEQTRTWSPKVTRPYARATQPPARENVPATNIRTQLRNDSSNGAYVDDSNRSRVNRSGASDWVSDRDFAKREELDSASGVFPEVRLDRPLGELENAPTRVQQKTRTAALRPNNTTSRVSDHESYPKPSAPAANTNQPSSPETRLSNFITSDKRASNEFAPVDSTGPTPLLSRLESNENIWPALPPEPNFDVADELTAKEQQMEALRRLEHEQRGILWNA